jgi:dolichol-phosphate mannosyltransferase
MIDSQERLATVVLPTYNERDNIGRLIERLDALGCLHELIVVDDASPDGTAAAVRSMRTRVQIHLLERSGKLGLASAILDGIRMSHGQHIVVMDADLSHDPSIIPRMLQALDSADVAVGSRFADGGGMVGWPLQRQAMSWLATRVAQLLFGIRERDPMSGYFAIHRSVFDRIAPLLRPRGYKILLELLVRGAPLRTEEIGYVFQDRQYGKSKLSWTITREYGTMLFALMFRRRSRSARNQ